MCTNSQLSHSLYMNCQLGHFCIQMEDSCIQKDIRKFKIYIYESNTGPPEDLEKFRGTGVEQHLGHSQCTPEHACDRDARGKNKGVAVGGIPLSRKQQQTTSRIIIRAWEGSTMNSEEEQYSETSGSWAICTH